MLFHFHFLGWFSVSKKVIGAHKVELANELAELLMLSKHHASPPTSARQTQKQLVSRAASLLHFHFFELFSVIKEAHKVELASELAEPLMPSKHHASPPAFARQTQKQLVSRVPSPLGLSCHHHYLRPGNVAPTVALPVMRWV